MDRRGSSGRLDQARGGSGGIHSGGLSRQQRIAFAALLITVALSVPVRAGDISFDPGITQQQFHMFSAVVAEGIYATPVEPASARGIFSFDVGVGVTALRINKEAAFWVNSVGSDFSKDNYVLVPRLIVSKGLGFATLSASYAQVQGSKARMWGASADVPIIHGGLVEPSLSVRGSYADLGGVDVFHLKTYGAELFLSKGFGPVTPYGAVGMMRSNSTGFVEIGGFPTLELSDRASHTRVTAGLRFSLLVTKIVVEATQAQDRTYSAKVAFGL